MMPRVTDSRVVLNLGVSAISGTLGLHASLSLGSSGARAGPRRAPALYAGLTYPYGTLWFTSAFFLASIGLSCVTVFLGRRPRTTTTAPLPAYPHCHRSDSLCVDVVIGGRGVVVQDRGWIID